jgi:hypothetical protein
MEIGVYYWLNTGYCEGPEGILNSDFGNYGKAGACSNSSLRVAGFTVLSLDKESFSC